MSVLTSMFNPRAPTLAAVEKERKTLCNEEELNERVEDARKKEEQLYPVISPEQFDQTVTPISAVYTCFHCFFWAALHSIFPPCDDCLSVLSDPKEDFQPVTLSGLDLPTNSVVTFISPISSPSKIPSNPASPDETPTSLLRSTNNPANAIPDAASFPSTGLQFSISLP